MPDDSHYLWWTIHGLWQNGRPSCSERVVRIGSGQICRFAETAEESAELSLSHPCIATTKHCQTRQRNSKGAATPAIQCNIFTFCLISYYILLPSSFPCHETMNTDDTPLIVVTSHNMTSQYKSTPRRTWIALLRHAGSVNALLLM
jgi:hypothetical protein